MKFQWGYCDVCKCAFVYCPKCLTATCSSVGELDGVKCDVCELAYQYDKLATETKTQPTKEWIKDNPADIAFQKSWFELDLEKERKNIDSSNISDILKDKLST